MWFRFAMSQMYLTLAVAVGILGFIVWMLIAEFTFWHQEFRYRQGLRVFWFFYSIGVGALAGKISYDFLQWITGQQSQPTTHHYPTNPTA